MLAHGTILERTALLSKLLTPGLKLASVKGSSAKQAPILFYVFHRCVLALPVLPGADICESVPAENISSLLEN